MPEEKKTPTTTPSTSQTQTTQQPQTHPQPPTTPTTDTSPSTSQGATQEQGQEPTTQQNPQNPQDPTTLTDDRLTDLELKEMNTLTALDEPTEEQKKRLSELQQRLPKNPAKLRSKQRQ
jgi:hypothetical protein